MRLDEIIKRPRTWEKRSNVSVLRHSSLRNSLDENESAWETEEQPVSREQHQTDEGQPRDVKPPAEGNQGRLWSCSSTHEAGKLCRSSAHIRISFGWISHKISPNWKHVACTAMKNQPGRQRTKERLGKSGRVSKHDSQKNKHACSLASLGRMFSEDALNQRGQPYTSFLPRVI